MDPAEKLCNHASKKFFINSGRFHFLSELSLKKHLKPEIKYKTGGSENQNAGKQHGIMKTRS
jgi:hypothetical protein